jgi:uncharacterized protein
VGRLPIRGCTKMSKAALFATLCLLLMGSVQFARAESNSRSVISTFEEKKRQSAEQSKSVISVYDGQKKRESRQIAVTVVVSRTGLRFADDMRNVVNDRRPDGQRVLPVVGVGGLQNLEDIMFLDDIDMGVVDEDNLRLLKKRDPSLFAKIEQRVQYITRLYDSEFHIIARNEIKTFEEMRGRKVNFGLEDGESEVTADFVFNALKLDTVRSYYDDDVAIKKVINGEIDAMIVLASAPQEKFVELKHEDDVHFLPFDESSSPDSNVKQVLADYLPAELTHEQYPVLIPEGQTVPTLATRALLVTYAWSENSVRYNKVATFVREFFERNDQFHDGARHPKWNEINIAANMPGWARFKPAADWLAEHQHAAGGTPELKLTFHEFLNQYASAHGLKTISDGDREILFAKFQQFLRSQNSAVIRSR